MCEYPPEAFEKESYFQFVKVLGLFWEPSNAIFFSSLKLLELPLILPNAFGIPRYISAALPTRGLHGFADASSQAYAGVIFSLVEINNGYAVILIMAKTRVAPIKTISFLCLQLNAALQLSR